MLFRGVGQFGRPPALGVGSRRFKSCRLDGLTYMRIYGRLKNTGMKRREVLLRYGKSEVAGSSPVNQSFLVVAQLGRALT